MPKTPLQYSNLHYSGLRATLMTTASRCHAVFYANLASMQYKCRKLLKYIEIGIETRIIFLLLKMEGNY
jgi:hypothetical protein